VETTIVTDSRLVEAVEHALRAPSVHNTQPWRWRIGPDTIELHADWDRHLTVTDPDRRDLVISCGAALHHLRVALAAHGIPADVERLPDPEERRHLATVVIRSHDTGAPATETTDSDSTEAALFPAIAERRTDRRRMSHRPVPRDCLRSLAEHAAHAGALLVPVTDPAVRGRLLALLVEAAHAQAVEPGYAAELRMWSDRLPGAHDGVPAANVAAAPIGASRPSPLRRFTHSALNQSPQQPGHGPGDDSAELLVITTPGDTDLDRLRAGEATSAVLLAATRLGLATTPLSQALEVPASRRHLQRDVIHAPETPQLVIRVGWPASGAADLPATPRRSLAHMLLR
jgi:nitroreductase